MIVHYENKLWELDMPYLLFESLKKSQPDYTVEIMEKTSSNYKKIRTAKIHDLEDYSVFRNVNALSSKLSK